MKARPVRITEALSGGFLVHVPISRFGDAEARLDISDYNDLVALKVYPNWCLVGGCVHARGPNGLRILVARVITDARPGQVVEYLDGDPLNLTTANLALKDGFSTKHDRALLIEAREKFEADKSGRIEAGTYHPRYRRPEIFFNRPKDRKAAFV